MESSKHLCQSCNCLVEEDENYCSICGQKKITKTASLRELIGDFFANIFSLDSKFFRTFRPLFFNPGKLTNEYLAGKRKLYYTPIRMFLFWMTIAFILFNFLISRVMEESHDLEDNLELYLQIHKDSLQKELYLAFPDSISQQKIAEVFRKPPQTAEEAEEREKKENGSLSFFNFPTINQNDLILLSKEALFEKYKIENWWEKLIFGQIAKSIKRSDDFKLYLLSHLSWLVLFSVPFVAFFLKLLYIRQKRPYVAHLIYTLHLHSFLFAISSFLFIFLLLQEKDYASSTLFDYTLLLFLIYFIISIKKVYQQSIPKTMLKLFLFAIGYFIIIIIAVLLFLGLNFLVF